MSIPIECHPKLFRNRQNHVTVSHSSLKNTAHFRYKIIRVSLRTRKTKTTLAGETHPPKILPSTGAQVLTISTLLFSTPQHLPHYFIVILRAISLMTFLELSPMILEYLTESIPINSRHSLPLTFGPTLLTITIHLISLDKKCKFLYYRLKNDRHSSSAAGEAREEAVY